MQRIIEVRCKVDLNNKNQTPKTILDALATYLKSTQHEAKDNLAFYKRFKQNGESINDYFLVLDEMADQANLCEHCKKKTMAFQLLGGLRSDEIRQSVLALDPFPDLEGVLKKALSEELSRNDHSAFRVSGKDHQVHKLQRRQSKSPGRAGEKNKSTGSKNDTCRHCGNRSQPQGQKCWAAEVDCRKCKKKGHLERICRGGKIGQIKVCHLTSSQKAPLAQVMIHTTKSRNHKIEALPDTGAELTVMGRKTALKFGLKDHEVDHMDAVVMAADGLPMEVIGETEIEVDFNGKVTTTTAVISPECQGVILSWQVSEDLGIVRYDKTIRDSRQSGKTVHNMTKPQDKQVETPKKKRDETPKKMTVKENPSVEEVMNIKKKLMEEFKDVFTSDEEMILQPQKCEPMTIKLKEGAEPIQKTGVRQIPLAYRSEVKEILENMVTKGIIEEVTEEKDWCHPLVIVAKKDGDCRVCVDLTGLNKQVRRPHYPVRTPKDAVSNFPSGMKYFTTLDAKSGYWQIQLDKESQDLTTFMTPWARYKYLRCPMDSS